MLLGSLRERLLVRCLRMKPGPQFCTFSYPLNSALTENAREKVCREDSGDVYREWEEISQAGRASVWGREKGRERD